MNLNTSFCIKRAVSTVFLKINSFNLISENQPCPSCGVRFSSTVQQNESSNSYCMNLIRKYDYENYLSSLLLPQKVRRAAFAIRAFNVELSQIKDMVSTNAIGEMRIQFWKDALNSIFSEKPPHQPVALELYQAVKQFKLSKHWLRRLIDARGGRLSDKPFDSMNELENYSENSVSPVYYLLLETLCVKNINTDHVASHAGKAQGIANFIRGLPYHLKKQVVLIPNDIIIKHKLSHERILRGLEEQLLQDVIFDIASVAHHHVEMARNLKEKIPNETLPVFLPLVATSTYLKQLEKANFNPFDRKLQLRNSLIPYKLLWGRLRKRY